MGASDLIAVLVLAAWLLGLARVAVAVASVGHRRAMEMPREELERAVERAVLAHHPAWWKQIRRVFEYSSLVLAIVVLAR